MDLSNLYAQAETVIKLTNPETKETLYVDDDKKIPMTWTLVSRHTKEYKKLALDFTKELRKEIGDIQLDHMTEEQQAKMEELTTNLTIRASRGFCINICGKTPKFSASKAQEILTDERLFWLREQVQIGANEISNFMPH